MIIYIQDYVQGHKKTLCFRMSHLHRGLCVIRKRSVERAETKTMTQPHIMAAGFSFCLLPSLGTGAEACGIALFLPGHSFAPGQGSPILSWRVWCRSPFSLSQLGRLALFFFWNLLHLPQNIPPRHLSKLFLHSPPLRSPQGCMAHNS